MCPLGRVTLVAIVAAVGILAAAPVQASSTDGVVVAPPKPLGGALIGEELRQVLGLPLGENPAAGADNCLFAGPRNAILLLWTTREPDPVPECSVRPGTPIFFYALGGECSSVEDSAVLRAHRGTAAPVHPRLLERYAGRRHPRPSR